MIAGANLSSSNRSRQAAQVAACSVTSAAALDDRLLPCFVAVRKFLHFILLYPRDIILRFSLSWSLARALRKACLARKALIFTLASDQPIICDISRTVLFSA